MDFYKITALSFALALTCTTCTKKENCETPEGLQGDWIWEKSVGGFGGWTEDPQSSGLTKSLTIDDFYFREFVNDSMVFETQYDVEIRPDSVLNTNRYLLFSKGGERAVWYDMNQLELHELCADCFSHYYRRK